MLGERLTLGLGAGRVVSLVTALTTARRMIATFDLQCCRELVTPCSPVRERALLAKQWDPR